MSEEKDSKRIARNSIILYFRMMFQMAVSLYTVRLVLKQLGDNDYGIYDVAGGIVTLLIFLNNSLTTCSQRYITFALGTKDKEYLRRAFSMSVNIHFLLAILIIILGETIGLWYIFNHLNVPQERINDTVIVYQCSLLAGVLLILSVPYNSCIIAHEKMTAFASISIMDVTLKLCAALTLFLIPSESRLIIYAALMATAAIITRTTYGLYCKYTFKEIKYRWEADKKLFHEMLKFAGWSTFGNFSIACNNQGLNLVLNYLGGPALNAARAIAFQVQTAVVQFIASFQTAINPHITKTYAQGKKEYLNELILRSSRLSFMLVIIMIIPLIIEANGILCIWLDKVPQYSVTFMRILLCVTMMDAIANPMMVSAAATGNIKKYHLYIGSTLLTVVPLSIIVIYIFPTHPEYIYITLLIITIIAQIIRMRICKELFDFDNFAFIKGVLSRILLCGTVAFSLPMFLHYTLSHCIINTILICFISIMWTLLCIFVLGIRKDERNFIINKIKK